jgi:hypothetical protein
MSKARRSRPGRLPWLLALAALALPVLKVGFPAAADGPAAQPCSWDIGWQVVRELELPRRDSGGKSIGGFSAVHAPAGSERLWLLSDLPQGSITVWSGLGAALGGEAELRLERTLPLASGREAALPRQMDGEGLVRLGDQLWVASEGRRLRQRPVQLLRFQADSGLLLEALALPGDWQPGRGQGLASNAGPESLALLPEPDGSPALLMAAERPLLQDPPRQVRLLRWHWVEGQDPRRDPPVATDQGSLLLPEGEGWGLTDLMVMDSGQLLALLRRFELPITWEIRLALYPLPAAADGNPAAPLAEWDLIGAGLTPDNWEGLTTGPPLADGRPSLLLVSDDNLSPLQANRVAQLAPSRGSGCGAQPAAATSSVNSARQRRSWASAAAVPSAGNALRKSLSLAGM